jgi:hydrogenase maturation factor
MNLFYADIMRVFIEDNQRMGKIKVNGVLKNIPLMLVPDANDGDRILVCDHVAVSKMKTQNGGDYVLSNSWESA